MSIQPCLKEYLGFHRYINMTFMFTKVQNISREFANVRVKRNWCIPYLVSRKLRAPSSARLFYQPFIQQVIDIIDPYLIQTIILRIYHSYSYPSLHHCNNSFQIMIILCNYVRCVHRARAEQESKNASKGQKYTKTIKQNTPKYSFSQPPRWTLNSYKLSPSQYIPPHGSVCYITTCSLTMLNNIFPDQKQVHFFIQLNHKSWVLKQN